MPMSLIQEDNTKPVVNLLDCEKFEDTFGPKARRFRPKLNFENLEDLASGCKEKDTNYNADKDRDLKKTQDRKSVV